MRSLSSEAGTGLISPSPLRGDPFVIRDHTSQRAQLQEEPERHVFTTY